MLSERVLVPAMILIVSAELTVMAMVYCVPVVQPVPAPFVAGVAPLVVKHATVVPEFGFVQVTVCGTTPGVGVQVAGDA